ncbi:FAD-binding oxidoreductase [Anaerolineales bacterium HSG25]|nr:FAD-binding oxidoreductase [Anaerolineales bacterium HSG25]
MTKQSSLIPTIVGGLLGVTAIAWWRSTVSNVDKAPKTTEPEVGEAVSSHSNGQTSSWGNYPKISAQEYTFKTIDELRQLLKKLSDVIPRGNGRSYGDSALAPHLISTLDYKKFLSFDAEAGTICCQSGVLLSELLDVTVPKGWFLPVTPGTKLITVGGAIASDVHGKSQHKAGNFSDHIVSMDIMLTDGSIVTCSPTENEALFWTTCGGMGLTGVILQATMRLLPIETAYIIQEAVRADNLDQMMDLFEDSESWTYSVAWMDCLKQGKNMGRGFIMRGEHARLEDLAGDARRKHPFELKSRPKAIVPFNFPEFVLNGLTMRIFNELLYRKQFKRVIKSVIDYDVFFYPLDVIYKWNRIYGQRGFTQYQFILPKAKSREGLTTILNKMAERNIGPFLTVMKLYGKQNGYLPFAMEGYSLALDFPIRDGLFDLLDELDEIVLGYGGRIYLTKDARMTERMFKQTYPYVDTFLENLEKINHDHKFRSLQSDRIGLTNPHKD